MQGVLLLRQRSKNTPFHPFAAYRRPLRYDRSHNRQQKEQHAQANRHAEQNFFNATPGREHTAGIAASQSTQASTFTLQDDTGNQGN